MNINFTDKLNQKLLGLSIQNSIVNNQQLVMLFAITNITEIANAIKDSNNEKFNIEVDANFDNGNNGYDYLQGIDFDCMVDSIVVSLTELIQTDSKAKTFSIIFKPAYKRDILNLILTGTKKEIIEKLCLFACHSTQIINKKNEHCQKLISINLEEGIIAFNDDALLEFVQTSDKIDNDMRGVFNQYLISYKEKFEIMEKLENNLAKILK